MKEAIVKILAGELKGKLKKEKIEKLIEIPPSDELGDYAFPCFSLAKIEKKNPLLVAEELKEKLKLVKGVSNTEAKAGYVNFFIDKKILAEKVLRNYGKIEKKSKRKIMVEFPSPNTNKPLHLGHLRNMAIGESVSRILEAKGNKIIRANLNNDRGIHICKSMVAYEKFGKNQTPEKQRRKPDHFVGDYYVRFNNELKKNKNLEKQAQECLKKWEKGDKEIILLWKKMNKWALDGFKQTYKLFGIKPDKEYFESRIYKKGKKIIDFGLKKKIFEKGRGGEIKIDLEKEKLGEKVLLRADGTSLYITQDLYLAKLKNEEFKLDGSVYVAGNEQDYHFKVLFSILKKLEFKFADNLHHLSYGMVFLPEGRMKSREGRIVDADDLIEETWKLAKKELEKRERLFKKELENRSLKIALAAIKYFLLKVDISRNMVFNPDEAIGFEGNTGPYLLYSYARASSIIRKAKSKKKMKIIDLKNEEVRLLKKIAGFSDVVEQAYNQLEPNLIANYSYELASLFNEFYHAHSVLGSEEEGFRLKLVDAFRVTLKKALFLLGIDVLEEM